MQDLANENSQLQPCYMIKITDATEVPDNLALLNEAKSIVMRRESDIQGYVYDQSSPLSFNHLECLHPLKKQSSFRSDQTNQSHLHGSEESLSLLKRLNLCDLEAEDRHESFLQDEEKKHERQDCDGEASDEEFYDHGSALFDDDSIPMVKITTAPPMCEEDLQPFYQKQNTFNVGSGYGGSCLKGSSMLQIPDTKIN